MSVQPQSMPDKDRDIIRRLAEEVRGVSEDPVNLERKRLWYALDAGQAERPMVLTEPQLVFETYPESRLECTDESARYTERQLRYTLWQFHAIGDDHVVEPWYPVNWSVTDTGYGVEVKQEYAEKSEEGNVASRHWDPPIKDLDADFGKLQPRSFSVNREPTLAAKARLEDLFGDILEVPIRGAFWWTTGLTIRAIDFIGLEQMMMQMCMSPEGVHRLMAFLRDDQLALIDFLEEENLLSLNNANDYIGSGSMGYTHDLPQPHWQEGDPVRTKDQWVLSESQETVQVGPDMFEEFVFPYQRAIVERYGKLYYGCCEPVHNRWHVLKKFPNLARVSISPWCDQEIMAAELKRDYVFSRKPNPSFVSTKEMDESVILNDLRRTLEIARGCNVELILKDVHTLSGEPQRMRRWVELARQAIEETS